MESATHMDERQNGPGSLLLRFVNTRPIIKPDDDFDDAVSTQRWLVESGLVEDDALVTSADVAAVRELRQALVDVLKSHVGLHDPAATTASQEVLDRAARAHPIVPRIDASGASFAASQSGVAGALSAVLADSATAALDGRDWPRFKACKNPICYRGFHDDSRPGSALYCSHTCASQVGMRVYRARKAQSQKNP